MVKTQKTLEGIVGKAKGTWGKQLKYVMGVSEFEVLIERFATRFEGGFYLRKKGSHRSVIIRSVTITWSPKRRGKENVISSGVLEDALKKLSQAVDIPFDHIELYALGKGKLARVYKRKFEEEYL